MTIVKIPFLVWTGKAALEIEVSDSVEEGSRLRAALQIAVERGADLTDADLTDADLSGAKLRGAKLRGADLTYADLSGADLTYADLSGAKLRGANLTDAKLRDAKLRGADLTDADLSGAKLRGAKLRGADLTDAKLRDAKLRGADLIYADLRGADLTDADLSGAKLRGANLTDAKLRGAKASELTFARTSIVPDSGAFVGWKKCKNGVIVKVEIPAGAKRSNASGRKCRAEFVTVLEVIGADEGVSIHDGATAYRVGETIRCDQWDDNRWNECSGGIHFYITRAEAEAHQ